MYQVILDFIKYDYFIIVYGITWFISLVTYRKYFETSLRYFPILISYTFFNELLGSVIIQNESIQLIFGYDGTNHTALIYNIYHLCFFLFFFKIYWKAASEIKQKNNIKYGIYTYAIIEVINLFLQNPLIESLIYGYLFGVLLLIYCILNYFKEVFKVFKIKTLKFSLLFWISIGLLIFHVIYFPLKIFREFNYELYEPFRNLHLISIVVMYTFFSIGFIKSRKRNFS